MGRRRLTADERRAALLQAAKELSMEGGGATPSLDAIIRRVGGSRRSIYTCFGGKEGLQTALIDTVASEILAALVAREESNLRDTLTCLARNLLYTLLSPHGIGLSRIVLQNSFAAPERAKIFFERGPGKGAELLAQILERARRRGEIKVADSLAAANCFIGMARGNLYLEHVLLREPPGEAEVEAHIRMVVDIFLEGVRASTADDA
ncbi:MAG: TetR/AcrR family transcriptional regulator C-terminal domain-containing protein [Azoarcus sp.]|nr:TetR/AcrR family transcriptional regulator C-terminal domain-containing protein [Azoarcus sp.]